MKKMIIILFLTAMAFSALTQQSKTGPKVFISVDMEGVAGVVAGEECGPSGPDYMLFRRLMTLETNAAIEGALAAGATEIVVRDGHGKKTNILPELLLKEARLLRGLTERPENMMLGIDDSFDAVIFLGYHAKAGTPDGVIAHTSSGNVIDLTINGVSLPEAGYNALLAGLYGVPVVLVSGDNRICQQAKDLLGTLLTVETKKGFGTAALCLHPEKVRDLIRGETIRALKQLEMFRPYTLKPPYHMVLKIKNERGKYEGIRKIGEGEYDYISDNFLLVMDAFNALK